MRIYNRILFCLFVELLTSGCSGHLSFNELIKDIHTNLNKQTYLSAKMNYSIYLFDQFIFVDQEYDDTLSFELFVDTSMVYEEGASMISILKYKSKETKIDKEWKKLSSKRHLIEDFRIYSEGLTDYLPYSAYYEHSASTISKKNTETISFLFRGENSMFYIMSLEATTDEGYPDNMRELLYCAKTIKILPN
jgi:hypothetical protein